MGELILKGHRVVKGKASGEALVSDKPFCFFLEVDPRTGIVVEKGNDWEGISLAGKILVFPFGKGSTSSCYVIYEMARQGTQPKGIINQRADPIIVSGAALSNIPMIDRLDNNPVEVIETGDYVELDADNGIVKVRSRK